MKIQMRSFTLNHSKRVKLAEPCCRKKRSLNSLYALVIDVLKSLNRRRQGKLEIAVRATNLERMRRHCLRKDPTDIVGILSQKEYSDCSQSIGILN